MERGVGTLAGMQQRLVMAACRTVCHAVGGVFLAMHQ